LLDIPRYVIKRSQLPTELLKAIILVFSLDIIEVGAVMAKLRKACVLDYRKAAKEVMFLRPCPKPKFIKKLKELRLSQFLHYCP